MSMVQNLIKKAFGTSNINEAASFLASACNRMKAMDKRAIEGEVCAALKGVNFSRAGESSAQSEIRTKTIYKDTPDTTSKLRRIEAEAERLRRELSAAEDRRIRGLAELRRELSAAEDLRIRSLAELRADLMRHYGEALEVAQRGSDGWREANVHNDRLLSQIEELQMALDRRTFEENEFHELANSKDAEIEELQLSLERRTFENEALCTSLDSKDAEIEKLKHKLQLAGFLSLAEREEAENLCKRLDECDAQIAAHAVQSKEYQRIIAVKNAACDGYRQGIADRDAEFARLKNQLNKAGEQRDLSLKVAQNYKQWFENTASERDAATAASKANKAANVELACENAELKAQLARMKESGISGAILRALGASI
ncbi:hypothetical protein [Raoultella terrigena]|uniref:hypothetical protein n=1 Tax=Raoultella terrigena TaxID=577 RepID=UPI003BF51982